MTITLADLANLPPTLGADEVAEILGCTRWTLYGTVRDGTCPVTPLHLGRKLRWPTAAVLRAVGLDPEREETLGHALAEGLALVPDRHQVHEGRLHHESTS